MKTKKEFFITRGYKVIFACKYPKRKVEEILNGYIEEAMAELGVCFNTTKKGIKTYFLEMPKGEIDKSIDDIFK